MNKVIWIFWLQGWHEAPWLVRKCLASWQLHNPGWEVRALDAASVQSLVTLPDLHGKEITATSLSEIIRTLLLSEYGGVWTDATVLCHRPLDSWLPEAARQGFFAFAKPGPDRMLSSWFLAAEAGNSLLTRWRDAALDFWVRNDRADHYFWFHYSFARVHDADPDFAQAWSRVPEISAAGPHHAQVIGLGVERDPRVDHLLQSLPPVSKLTYRFDPSNLGPEALLSRLMAGLGEPELPVRSAASPSRPDRMPTLAPLSALPPP